MHYMSREEAILFQQEEVERIQAEQKATEQKAWPPSRQLMSFAGRPNLPILNASNEIAIFKPPKKSKTGWLPKRQQAKTEQDRVVNTKSESKRERSSARPNLGDFHAKTMRHSARS